MPSPIRSFINWIFIAAVAGIILWREHAWQVRMRQVLDATAAPVAATARVEGNESRLLENNAALQKQLVAAESRLSSLTAETNRLKQALEAAKPAPTPDSLAAQFKELRGLAFAPPPQWSPVPMQTILDNVRTRVEAQLPAESSQARSRAALAMGFHSEPFDYRGAVVSLAQMTSGGFYDATANSFLYREEAALKRADGREAFIGGLASALTVLKAGNTGNLYDPADDDAALALRSLMSGDANASRVRFSLADQLNLNFDKSGAPAAPPPNYSAPVFLAEIWKFSQDKGSQFIEVLAGQGGNAAVDAAYARPPKSSAEILHPELYQADPPFQPVPVTFAEPVIAGQSPYFTNVAGEIGSYIALRSWLGVDEATVASEGWAGDRYAIWPGEEGVGDHIFWKTVWRTEKDAQEFFDQMRRVIMQRFSIPWRKEYDAIANRFSVDDPRRIVRLKLESGTRTVTLGNATDSAFAAALEAAAEKWSNTP